MGPNFTMISSLMNIFCFMATLLPTGTSCVDSDNEYLDNKNLCLYVPVNSIYI